MICHSFMLLQAGGWIGQTALGECIRLVCVFCRLQGELLPVSGDGTSFGPRARGGFAGAAEIA